MTTGGAKQISGLPAFGTMTAILHALVERRFLRNGAGYVPWTIIYAMTGLVFWHGKWDRSPEDLISMWPGLIPLGVISLQCARPTLLAWAGILLFAALYNSLLVWVAFRAYAERESGEGISAGGVLSVIVFAGWVLIPLALIVRAKPKRFPASSSA